MVRVRDLLRREQEVKDSPRTAPLRPGSSVPDVTAPPWRGTIVLLSDDESTQGLVKAVAMGLGYECVLATKAADAAVLIRDQYPDAVLADASGGSSEAVLLRRVLMQNEAFSLVPFVALIPQERFRRVFGSEQRRNEEVVSTPLSSPLLHKAMVRALAAKPRVATPSDAGTETVDEHDEHGEHVPEPPAELPNDATGRQADGAPPRQLDVETYRRAVAAIDGILASPGSRDARLMQEALQASAAIVDCLQRGGGILKQALDRSQPFALADHSANVSVLCAMIGQGLDYSGEQLRRLAFVGLVHDLGMSRMPDQLLRKEGTLDATEAALIKTHPEHTHEIIASFGEEFAWAAEIAQQEHEREKGTGYPQGLQGDGIHEFAKIIAVADIFEAFTHPRTFRKTFISNGNVADHLLVFGKWSEIDDPKKAITAFVVDKATPGLEVLRKEEKMGHRAAPTVALSFEDMKIPRENIIGEPGDGLRILLSSLNKSRPSVAAHALGIARAAFEDAIDYINDRRQSGKRIVEFQGIQFTLRQRVADLS